MEKDRIAELVMVTKRPTLEEAQKFVGGYVELLWLDATTQMLVNEEGAYDESLLPNPMATRLAEKAGYLVTIGGIKGNAMVLTKGAIWD